MVQPPGDVPGEHMEAGWRSAGMPGAVTPAKPSGMCPLSHCNPPPVMAPF